ncbi:coiled-coil domain-containing protein 83 isoform X1 [Chiloscyllium plagiosum]|uniref:coiled-coil domain-containing protein 83 isoform X1 n=1 Tax=Chiloscyllium plagiosum TaxID=36176 RepID=UPI001CB848EB|nr:coiled-coil domain-containing protein 83 isoform X1 [Chiloscyllium plagiosum]XP_043547539.1 coiled-coil domain-containing protein 83 isoform X1 [Chiloscyllium plagiosum]
MAKKKKDSKGGSEDKMALAEVFLHFRFQLKEKAMERFRQEIQHLEEVKAQNIEHNEQLKKEQKEHIRILVRKAKELEKELERKEKINNEQVAQALKEKLEIIKQNKQQTQELLNSLKVVEQKILKEEEVKAYWLEYKNVGSIEHRRIITVRENELVELVKNFREIEDHFHRALARAKEEIDRIMKEQMNEKKAMAAENAVSYMGKYTRQQVKENAWLKKELNLYSLEVTNLEQAVQKVEQDNLKILSQLFDCQISDLNECRNLFKIRAAGSKSQDGGILEEELAKLAFRGEPSDALVEIHDASYNLPKLKSATLLASEKKVSSMQPYFKEEMTESDDKPQFQLGKSVSQNLTYLLQEDEKYFKYFDCGALEQKLLHVEGRAMPLEDIAQLPSQGKKNEETKSNEVAMVWPVTGTMLRSAIL